MSGLLTGIFSGISPADPLSAYLFTFLSGLITPLTPSHRRGRRPSRSVAAAAPLAAALLAAAPPGRWRLPPPLAAARAGWWWLPPCWLVVRACWECF